jgi:hypothetical protein
LEIAGGNQARPKDRHDVSRADFSFLDQFRAKPKTLDEHAHHYELGKTGGETPDRVKFFGCGTHALQNGCDSGLFV